MFHSPAGWKTKSVANTEYAKLSSRAAKLRAVKDQIKMRTVGFGWKDLHHAYSENGVEFEPDVLFKHLIDIVLPEQRKRRIPSKPTMQLPSRKFTPQLGTRSSDLQYLDDRYNDMKRDAIEAAEKMRDQLEDDGEVDRYEKLQPTTRPDVNKELIGVEIEMLYQHNEPCGKVVDQWCQGVVVAVKRGDKVQVCWSAETLFEGDDGITEEHLMKSKWNKHLPGGWRFSIGSLT